MKIKFTEITEEELIAKGATYIRDDKKQAFYVEKGSLSKFKDYSVRVVATPVTILADATVVALFVGGYALVEYAVDYAHSEGCRDCRYSTAEDRCPSCCH